MEIHVKIYLISTFSLIQVFNYNFIIMHSLFPYWSSKNSSWWRHKLGHT